MQTTQNNVHSNVTEAAAAKEEKAKAAAAKLAKQKAEAKAAEAAEAEATKAEVLKRQQEREAMRLQEKQQVKDTIKGLKPVIVPVVTESGKTAIDTKGEQITEVLDLSNLTGSIGKLIDKYGNSDLYLYVNGSIVRLPKGSNGSSRMKAFVKNLITAAFKKRTDFTVSLAVSLRAKYDYPLMNAKGEFIASEQSILEGMTIHETAKSQVKSLDKKVVAVFGHNPEKLGIIKDCKEGKKAMTEGNYLAALETVSKIKGSESLKLLNM